MGALCLLLHSSLDVTYLKLKYLKEKDWLLLTLVLPLLILRVDHWVTHGVVLLGPLHTGVTARPLPATHVSHHPPLLTGCGNHGEARTVM